MKIKDARQSASVALMLRLLRSEKGWSQTDLLQKIKEVLAETESALSPPTVGAISTWENGRNCPSIEMLKVICRIYSVSMDYITGHTETTDSSKLRKLIKRKSLDFMDGWPVWIPSNGSAEGKWGLVDVKDRKVLTNQGAIPFARLPDNLQTYPSTCEVGLFCASEETVLSLERLETMTNQSVWVEPVNSLFADMWRIRGIYQVYRSPDGGYVKNADDLVLSFSSYGKRWVAYPLDFDHITSVQR